MPPASTSSCPLAVRNFCSPALSCAMAHCCGITLAAAPVSKFTFNHPLSRCVRKGYGGEQGGSREESSR
eukprot:4903010-Amphidinium_carterae.1